MYFQYFQLLLSFLNTLYPFFRALLVFARVFQTNSPKRFMEHFSDEKIYFLLFFCCCWILWMLRSLWIYELKQNSFHYFATLLIFIFFLFAYRLWWVETHHKFYWETNSSARTLSKFFIKSTPILIKLGKNCRIFCQKCFYEFQLIKKYNIHNLIKNLKSTNDKVFITLNIYECSFSLYPRLFSRILLSNFGNFHKFSTEFCNIVQFCCVLKTANWLKLIRHETSIIERLHLTRQFHIFSTINISCH